MNVDLPTPVLHIIQTLQEAGYSVEIVGGAVRDLLLSKPTHDWDFATNAKPEQILSLFANSFNENVFGTVMFSHQHACEQFNLPPDPTQTDLLYDITTYRSDGTYENYRHPTSVTWGETIQEDLKRRDFTINAIALRVDKPLLTHPNHNLVYAQEIDPFHGQEDLQSKIIQTVGEPIDRLHEDALRMLRAIRLSVVLDFAIEDKTFEAIQTCADLLSHISKERISDEFVRILSCNQPKRGIELLDETGLLVSILPELLTMKEVKQSGHHIYDVWEHSLRALETCPSSDPVVRLSTLVHDIGKPSTAQVLADGSVTFYNHEVVGARIAKQIASRLRFSKSDIERVFTLVRWHMFMYDKDVTDAYIRRFIRRVGVENIHDMMALRTGDRLGSGSSATSWRLEELQDRIYEQLHQPLQVKDLLIDGHDVMEHLKLTPGPEIGKILNTLFEDVLEHPEHNTREYLFDQLNTVNKEAKTD